jgi:hypothetical protein
MQLATSICYNWTLLKRDLIAALREYPHNRALHPEFATIVDRRGTSAGNAQKEDSLGDSMAHTRTLPHLQG